MQFDHSSRGKTSNQTKTSDISGRWILFGVLALVVSTVAAYWPVFSAGYIWDDDAYVTHNPLLTTADGFRRIWSTAHSQSQYFPLVFTTLRLEYVLWGLNPVGYHVVNVCLHIVNALLVWSLLRRLALPGAWFAAALWALHPVQVETVAWVTELKNTESTLFYLLAVLAWLRFYAEGKRWFYALTVGLYVLALFSKTTACTLPAVLLLVLWLKHEPLNWRRLLQLAPFLGLGLCMGLITVWWERHLGNLQPEYKLLGGPLDRMLIASRALWFYIGKVFWPANLTFSYPRWHINAANAWQYLWLAACLTVAAMLWFGRRKLGRGPAVGLTFFVATLSPLLGFIPLYTFRFSYVADHYQYLACLGLIALAAAGIAELFSVLKNKRSWLETVFCGILLILMGVLTWRQSEIYVNGETLWRTTIVRNPSAYLAYTNLGFLLDQKGQVKEATANLQKAVEIQPDYAVAQHDLGTVLFQTGHFQEAIERFREALRLEPDYVAAHNSLGTVLFQTGHFQEAMEQFREALRLEPTYILAHNNLGTALARTGHFQEAIEQFQEVLRLQPDDATAHFDLGNALLQTGQMQEAIQQYQEALQLKPNDAAVHYSYGNALLLIGQLQQAIAQFRMVLQIQPDNVWACNSLGEIFWRQGQAGEAMFQFQKVLELEPNNMSAQNNLAWILATCPDGSLRNGRRAVELAQQADQLSGGQSPIILGTLAAAYAEVGRFPEATATAHKALQLAETQPNAATLVASLQEQIKDYEKGSPFRY